MNDDAKYLISSYQSTAADLFTQSIAINAKVRQLNDVVDALTAKIREQEEELTILRSKPDTVKPKVTRTKKTAGDAGSF